MRSPSFHCPRFFNSSTRSNRLSTFLLPPKAAALLKLRCCDIFQIPVVPPPHLEDHPGFEADALCSMPGGRCQSQSCQRPDQSRVKDREIREIRGKGRKQSEVWRAAHKQHPIHGLGVNGFFSSSCSCPHLFAAPPYGLTKPVNPPPRNPPIQRAGEIRPYKAPILRRRRTGWPAARDWARSTSNSATQSLYSSGSTSIC